MDMFKSLSVGAGDWIDIEEVREEVGEIHREDITCKEEKCGAEWFYCQDLFWAHSDEIWPY